MISMYSLPGIFSKDARHCINGTWETRAQYVTNLLKGYYAETLWHEFGHSLGMRHNFMGSVDRNNWPHYKDGAGRDHIGLYESSIMDYNIAADSTFWAGAASASGGTASTVSPAGRRTTRQLSPWIYGNSSTTLDSLDSGKPTGVQGASISGQSGSALVAPGSASAGKTVTAANARWNDPFGYCPASGTTASGQPCTAGNEIQYLFCTDQHIKYTPFCRQFDFGTTPSEIIAEQIDDYEWQYLWRNFPQYHQFFDYTQYADGPSQVLHREPPVPVVVGLRLVAGRAQRQLPQARRRTAAEHAGRRLLRRPRERVQPGRVDGQPAVRGDLAGHHPAVVR